MCMFVCVCVCVCVCVYVCVCVCGVCLYILYYECVLITSDHMCAVFQITDSHCGNDRQDC